MPAAATMKSAGTRFALCPPYAGLGARGFEPLEPPARQTAMVPVPAKWYMLKITRSRFIWLLCGAALIGAVSIAAARVATLTLADDAQTCRKKSGDTAIAACSRAIASG